MASPKEAACRSLRPRRLRVHLAHRPPFTAERSGSAAGRARSARTVGWNPLLALTAVQTGLIGNKTDREDG